MSAACDPRGVFINDPAFFALSLAQQKALRRGQLTPLEAREALLSPIPVPALIRMLYAKQYGGRG